MADFGKHLQHKSIKLKFPTFHLEKNGLDDDEGLMGDLWKKQRRKGIARKTVSGGHKLEQYNVRISELQGMLTDLLASEPTPLSNILTTKPLRFEVEGVYAISTPSDREVVYVGKTIRKHVVGRLYDHKHMDASSDLNIIVKRFPTYPQRIDDYLVRCLKITDPRARGFFENFAIGILQPTFNR